MDVHVDDKEIVLDDDCQKVHRDECENVKSKLSSIEIQ